MPRDKDRKRIIRTRMEKTGESYTTARAHVISKTREKAQPAPRVDHAALAGMSDQSVAAKTGHTWQEWVRLLDADEAAAMRHRDIAALVHGKHGVGDWWAQTVTVGYERIKGLRDLGQRRDGAYRGQQEQDAQRSGQDAFPRLGRRRDSTPLARRRQGQRAHGDRAEIDAAAVARRHDRRRRLHAEEQREEHGRSHAHEAARPGRVRRGEEVLGRSPRCAGVAARRAQRVNGRGGRCVAAPPLARQTATPSIVAPTSAACSPISSKCQSIVPTRKVTRWSW